MPRRCNPTARRVTLLPPPASFAFRIYGRPRCPPSSTGATPCGGAGQISCAVNVHGGRGLDQRLRHHQLPVAQASGNPVRRAVRRGGSEMGRRPATIRDTNAMHASAEVLARLSWTNRMVASAALCGAIVLAGLGVAHHLHRTPRSLAIPPRARTVASLTQAANRSLAADSRPHATTHATKLNVLPASNFQERRTATTIPPSLSQATRTRTLQMYAALPMSFEANAGQADPRVKFLAHAPSYSLFLTDRRGGPFASRTVARRETAPRRRPHSPCWSATASKSCPRRGRKVPGRQRGCRRCWER